MEEQIKNNLKKKFPIVLLPYTGRLGFNCNIWKKESGELRYSYSSPSKTGWKLQQLYVYTKEIKCGAGEWHYDSLRKVITRTITKIPNPNTCFKILASCETILSNYKFSIPSEFTENYVKSYRKCINISEIELDLIPSDEGLYSIGVSLENGQMALFNIRTRNNKYLITNFCPENFNISNNIKQKNKIVDSISSVICKETETVPDWKIDHISEKIYDILNNAFQLIEKK